MRESLEEFEYIRHGTLDVFAFLRHADGQVSIECQANHKTETFLGVFRRHADRFPHTEPLHYVMDSPETLETALDAFATDWNTLLAYPFKWSYDGRGLHEKAVQRFTKMFLCSAAQMELRILTQQMRLLTNLLRDYASQVSSETWAQFAAALRSQSHTIVEVIQDEEAPTSKLNAQQALARLNEALHSTRRFRLHPNNRRVRNNNCQNHAQNFWDGLRVAQKESHS